MSSNYKRIGDYIELVDERNTALSIDLLLGLTVEKRFIPSVANTVGTNMKNYKIIRKNQFACSTMQVRRDKKMPIAILKDFEEAIISQAYPVFQVVDESLLDPDYLMMWFSRKEFDRQATFHAVGGVRGSLEWEDFLDFELPIPSIEKQREIVDEYNTVTNRIKLNEQLNQKLEETAQALYKHWFVDFEFPNEEGKPYKSSGGEMVYNEELDKEIPKGWNPLKIGELVETQYGFTASANEDNEGPKFLRITDIAQDYIEWSSVPYCKISNKNLEKYLIKEGDILIARTGASSGSSKRIHKNSPRAVFASFLVRFTPNEKEYSMYLGLIVDNPIYREFILNNAGGSAQPQANVPLLTSYEIIKPLKAIINRFNLLVESIFDLKESVQIENQILNELQSVLLSKMSKVEEALINK